MQKSTVKPPIKFVDAQRVRIDLARQFHETLENIFADDEDDLILDTTYACETPTTSHVDNDRSTSKDPTFVIDQFKELNKTVDLFLAQLEQRKRLLRDHRASATQEVKQVQEEEEEEEPPAKCAPVALKRQVVELRQELQRVRAEKVLLGEEKEKRRAVMVRARTERETALVTSVERRWRERQEAMVNERHSLQLLGRQWRAERLQLIAMEEELQKQLQVERDRVGRYRAWMDEKAQFVGVEHEKMRVHYEGLIERWRQRCKRMEKRTTAAA